MKHIAFEALPPFPPPFNQRLADDRSPPVKARSDQRHVDGRPVHDQGSPGVSSQHLRLAGLYETAAASLTSETDQRPAGGPPPHSQPAVDARRAAPDLNSVMLSRTANV